ncbi:hypothetical protein [Ornithinimicrobium flavum]|uniref:hypothetical protein n=1 Tax=Ornithinimicrobium flavum TaxID=1288636 RepID=UPI00106FABE2|nr:hypothetical protein [Ornithinimicrobium flavum]
MDFTFSYTQGININRLTATNGAGFSNGTKTGVTLTRNEASVGSAFLNVAAANSANLQTFSLSLTTAGCGTVAVCGQFLKQVCSVPCTG